MCRGHYLMMAWPSSTDGERVRKIWWARIAIQMTAKICLCFSFDYYIYACVSSSSSLFLLMREWRKCFLFLGVSSCVTQYRRYVCIPYSTWAGTFSPLKRKIYSLFNLRLFYDNLLSNTFRVLHIVRLMDFMKWSPWHRSNCIHNNNRYFMWFFIVASVLRVRMRISYAY